MPLAVGKMKKFNEKEKKNTNRKKKKPSSLFYTRKLLFC
jgi:hypothetical protein